MPTKKKMPTAIYMNWLENQLIYRLQQQLANPVPPIIKWELPEVKNTDPLQKIINNKNWSAAEVSLVLLALAPHLDPTFFERTILPQLPSSNDFPQIGGYRGQTHRGFLPTGITFLFLMGDNDWEGQQKWAALFSEQHDFAREHVLELAVVPPGEPMLSGALIVHPEFLQLCTTGVVKAPRLSSHFPAHRLQTELEWNDVVLPLNTLQQVQEVQLWIQHQDTIRNNWGMGRQLKPGYRVLFHGPSGTGKTMTAALLGKYAGKEVYLINLSVLVSKYIGETEKNLESLFKQAERKDWILFFDEADALFGKRSQVKDAHDRYANQEVAYLLQRIETFDGLVVLATNAKSNIDEAFVRRFQSIIHFPMPLVAERKQIWQQAFPKVLRFEADIDLDLIARKYELSGAAILNIVAHCCLMLAAKGEQTIHQQLLLQGIRRELLKQNKVWQEA